MYSQGHFTEKLHYTIESKGSSWNLNQVEGFKIPLDTNEPTAPYIIGRELNLWKLPGRQWESNPQPSEQLRPMTIKTSASTETAPVTCNVIVYHRAYLQ